MQFKGYFACSIPGIPGGMKRSTTVSRSPGTTLPLQPIGPIGAIGAIGKMEAAPCEYQAGHDRFL